MSYYRLSLLLDKSLENLKAKTGRTSVNLFIYGGHFNTLFSAFPKFTIPADYVTLHC